MTRKVFIKKVKENSSPSEFKEWGFMLKYVPPFYFDKFLLMADDGLSLVTMLCKTMEDISRLRVFFTDNEAYTNPTQIQKDFTNLFKMRKAKRWITKK